VRLHPRTQSANFAKSNLAIAILGLIDETDLTLIEAIQALQDIQTGLLKHELRAERHNHEDEYGDLPKADEACDTGGCPGNYPSRLTSGS